jgi:hypothetical protein
MATFSLVVTYPDADQTRILNALKTYWTTVDANNNPVIPSTPQVTEKLRQVVISNVKDIIYRVERDAAIAAAAANVVTANIT